MVTDLQNLLLIMIKVHLDVRESIMPGKHHAIHVGKTAARRENSVSLKHFQIFCNFSFMLIILAGKHFLGKRCDICSQNGSCHVTGNN